jgi:hypothetical protein
LRELVAKYHSENAYEIASVNAFRNQSDEAFGWLDRAYAKHQEDVIFYESRPSTEELAQRPAICRALEEAQPAELT